MMKVKYSAPKLHRLNRDFTHFEELDASYSDNIIIDYTNRVILNEFEHKQKLYNAEPCIYTDVNYNYDNISGINFSRKPRSLKAMVRCLNTFKNLTNRTLNLTIMNRCYLQLKDGGVKHSLDVGYTKKKYNGIIEYNFNDKIDINKIRDPKVKELISNLNNIGFYIVVEVDEYTEDKNLVFDVYGANKRIGISEFNNPMLGYIDGCDNILWDEFGDFNKWSRCEQISKELSVSEIIKLIIGDDMKMLSRNRLLKIDKLIKTKTPSMS